MTVDDFVAVRALKEPESSTAFNEQVATSSISIGWKQQIPTDFNKV
jgi:hypothetical protein